MNQLGWQRRNLFIFLTMVFLCVPFHDHTIVLVLNQVISITDSKIKRKKTNNIHTKLHTEILKL